jgi:hypothetical protein
VGVTQEESGAVYEITLRGTPPANLAARFPCVTLYSSPAVTVLSRRVVDPLEIDELVEKLRSLGIAPLEVRASAGNYEFRIEGRLSDSTLRSMQWAARLDQERTVMLITATQPELQKILNVLADSGIDIDHLIRHAA